MRARDFVLSINPSRFFNIKNHKTQLKISKKICRAGDRQRYGDKP